MLSPQVNNMASGGNEKSTSEASEILPQVKPDDKTTAKSLKPKSKIVKKIVKKSINKTSAQAKEAKSTTEVEAGDGDQNTTKSLKHEPALVKKSLDGNSPQVKEEKLTSEVKAKDEDQNTSKSLNSARKIVKKLVKKSLNRNPAQAEEAKLTTDVKAGDEELKTPKSLKPKPKIVKKSSNDNSVQTKAAKLTSKVKAREEGAKNTTVGGKQPSNPSSRNDGRNKDLLRGSKEKKITTKSLGEHSKLDQEAGEDVAGLIFMCNKKTKPDCFRYHVMGMSTANQQLVMDIKPGLKLFLYDYQLKLLYGIYKASSAGGMRLEPDAFGGGFPFQVRFKVHRDCLPLPEAEFKKAIKESYNEKTGKFKMVLTSRQVQKLTELFRTPTTPHLNSHVQSTVRDPQPASVTRARPVATRYSEDARKEKVHRDHYSSDHDRKPIPRRAISPKDIASPSPLFLSEKEYRNYGLRRERQMNPPCSGDQVHKETSALDQPLFLSEKEYRAYGLRREARSIAMPPTLETAPTAPENYPMDPYYRRNYDASSTLVDSYYHHSYSGNSSLVDPCLPPSAIPSEPHSTAAREIQMNDYSFAEDDTRHHRRRMVYDEAERPYSDYASRALSDYNREYQHLGGGQLEAASSSVSSRYAFAGPPLSYR